MPKRKEKTAKAKSMSVWTDIETIDEIERIMEETGNFLSVREQKMVMSLKVQSHSKEAIML